MMAGVPDARFDAVQLYKFVTGRDPRLDNGPTPDEASSLRVLGERRAAREPLQYLLGEWDFMDFTLKVGRGVLCPRADSEVVCEAAIELLKDAEAPVVYDLCAGTGCLGLGIARHLPGAAVTCVEKSADAWPYLTANVAGTGVQAVQDCKKMMMMAKAGKYNGYLLEGMGCPGGCIGGAGTIADPTRTAVALNKYVKEAPFQDPEQSPFMTSIHVLKDDPDFEV